MGKCRNTGFNGAGVLRPRKYFIVGELGDRIEKLQWGRGFKTPEIWRVLLRAADRYALQWGRGFKTPEMAALPAAEPTAEALQWGRGFKTPEIRYTDAKMERYRRFNGAGVLRPRKSCRSFC